MTKLTFDKYDERAHSTIANSTADHLDRVMNAEFIGLLRRFVEMSRTIDTYKKAAFYGRNIETFPEPLHPFDRKGVDFQVFHGILGVAGEAGEVVEILLDRLDGKDTGEDLKGELGDVLWYLTVASKGDGTSIAEVAQANNEKLAARWGGKTSQNDFKS